MSSKGSTQKSPCVDICQIDARTRWCVGCGRTVDEIKTWAKMSPYRQTAVFSELKRRVAQIEHRKNCGDAFSNTNIERGTTRGARSGR